MLKPTTKQLKILSFIKVYSDQYNQSPTWQEIANYCKYKARQSVQSHTKYLIKKGYLKINKRLWQRNLSLTDKAIEFLKGGEIK